MITTDTTPKIRDRKVTFAFLIQLKIFSDNRTRGIPRRRVTPISNPGILEDPSGGEIKVSGINPEGLDLGKTPYVDQIYLGSFEIYNKGNLASYYSQSLQNLKPGLNVILIHPAFDDPEMKSITIDHPNFGSEWRQIDLDFFTSPVCKDILKDAHIKLITWKEIKNVIYTENSNLKRN